MKNRNKRIECNVVNKMYRCYCAIIGKVDVESQTDLRYSNTSSDSNVNEYSNATHWSPTCLWKQSSLSFSFLDPLGSTPRSVAFRQLRVKPLYCRRGSSPVLRLAPYDLTGSGRIVSRDGHVERSSPVSSATLANPGYFQIMSSLFE